MARGSTSAETHCSICIRKSPLPGVKVRSRSKSASLSSCGRVESPLMRHVRGQSIAKSWMACCQDDESPMPASSFQPASFVVPMAARIVDRLPEGSDWIYEVKFDGYRALLIKNADHLQIRSRNNKDLTRA